MKKTVPSVEARPTANDLARAAGVSLATVDRVLNARPGVRSATVEKVNKAIADLGYVRDSTAANLARRRVYNLLFILPQTSNEFVKALEEHEVPVREEWIFAGDFDLNSGREVARKIMKMDENVSKPFHLTVPHISNNKTNQIQFSVYPFPLSSRTICQPCSDASKHFANVAIDTYPQNKFN